MESSIGLYKTACVLPGPFHAERLKTIADVEYATMAWSTGGTTRACIPPSAMSHPSRTNKPTTLPSTPRCSPRETGKPDGSEQASTQRPVNDPGYVRLRWTIGAKPAMAARVSMTNHMPCEEPS